MLSGFELYPRWVPLDYVHPDDQTQPFEMTLGFKPFTVYYLLERVFVFNRLNI